MTVLVVHGIGNRDRAAFEREVVLVAEALAPRDVRPVFWGDLGPDRAFGCLPAAGEGRGLDDDGELVPTNGAIERGDELAGRVHELVEERTGEPVPVATDELVRGVLAEAARDGRSLAADEIADAVAETVVLTGPTGSAELGADEPGVFSRVRRGLRNVVDAVDRNVDEYSHQKLTELLREKGAGLTGTIASTVGDVLAYQRNGEEIRGRLDRAYRDALSAGEPVSILAHSLGGLVSVEWLLGAPVSDADATPLVERRVATLITFGTQVSLFCELHGLLGAAGVTDNVPPVMLPIAVDRWINVWHALDPLAFVMAPVLAIEGADGSEVPVEDRRLDPEGIGVSLTHHSSYWHDQRFLRWLAKTV
jgi:hypothetical protein